MALKYVVFSFDGDVFPIAKQLQDEGNDVSVCQIQDAKELEIDSWISDEDAEKKKRRLSLYNGILEKYSLSKMMSALKKVEDKDEYFIIFGFNALCKISEKVKEMGFTKGMFPLTEDYERERDRKLSKEFVKRYYPDIKQKETKEFSDVDKLINFITESDKVWVVKNEGNFTETLVPDRDDLQMAKEQIISELNEDRDGWSKSKNIVEEKIVNPIEFCPQIVFWDGIPVYSQVEIETRMFGSGDIGAQTGGNENLIVKTDLDCKLNKICFPSIVYEIAKKRKGLFIFDLGVLSDGKNFFFTEFAGNRFGWCGVFSELTASQYRNKIASNYFELVSEGKDPYKYNFGASLSLYNTEVDKDIASLPKGGTPIYIRGDAKDRFYILQCKEEKNKLKTIGYVEPGISPLGAVTGNGDTIESAVDSIYKTLENISIKGIYYRPKFDFLSIDYYSSVLNRFSYLFDNGFLDKEK